MPSLGERMRRLVALLSLVIAGACGNPTGPKDDPSIDNPR